jgi:hypothetical protein
VKEVLVSKIVLNYKSVLSNFNSSDTEDYICGTVKKGIIIQGQLVNNT